MSDSAVGATGLYEDVTEESIELLVERFYAAVQEHETLGPVFNPRLKGRWGRHLAQMKDFWSSVLLRSGRYQGFPLGAHYDVPGMQQEQFADWLRLFKVTLNEVYHPGIAEAILKVARQFAVRFSDALYGEPNIGDEAS